MEEQKPLSELIGESFSTKHKDEFPYLLTPEEEAEHIRIEIESMIDHFKWRRKSLWGVSLSEFSLENKRRMLEEEIEGIDWESKINKKELFESRNKLKYWAQEEERRKQERKIQKDKEQTELRERYTSKFVFDFISKNSAEYGCKFVYNQHNSKYIKSLCHFISKDERFETEMDYSFKKGLLIRGDYGRGKTHAIKCVSQNEVLPIRIFSMIDITREVEREGVFPIYYTPNSIICIDDVGTEEPIVNHYGTKINWFKNFIEGYYAQFNTYESLIITTNCSFQEIEQKYGGRVRSRMAQMFNVIDVEGDDFRKK